MRNHKSQNSPPQLRNTKPRGSTEQSFQLVEKIIEEEILWRLPVKSLLRFRCVSKSWLALIDSDRFIKIHLQNSTKNTSLAHHGVIFQGKRGVMNGCSLQSLKSKSKSKEGCMIMIDPTNNLAETGYLVGCCNGVLCFYSSNCPDGVFWLWNPATRVRVELPRAGRAYFKCGFGRSESSGAYKVFAGVFEYGQVHSGRWGKVYSSETNSWKTIPLGSPSLFNGVGQFVRGRIHWAKGRCLKHEIEYFDLESDKFGRIELPPPYFNNTGGGRRPFTSLGEFRGCLCASFDHKEGVDVWIMKEYGVKDSWFKLLTFPLAVCEPSRLRRKFGAHNPLFGEGGPNGEIFMIYGYTFMLYSPKDTDDDDDDAFTTATNVIRFRAAHIYVEGLVSPQRILDGTNTV